MKPPIEIIKPCHADWREMKGGERRRLCAQCDKHVHNLSALTPRALRKFTEQRNGTECIAYVYRADGTIETASRWAWLWRWFSPLRAGAAWLLIALLPSVFSGCGMRRSRVTAGGPALPSHLRSTAADHKQLLAGEAPPIPVPGKSQPLR